MIFCHSFVSDVTLRQFLKKPLLILACDSPEAILCVCLNNLGCYSLITNPNTEVLIKLCNFSLKQSGNIS
jgi:hypothetical protein